MNEDLGSRGSAVERSLRRTHRLTRSGSAALVGGLVGLLLVAAVVIGMFWQVTADQEAQGTQRSQQIAAEAQQIAAQTVQLAQLKSAQSVLLTDVQALEAQVVSLGAKPVVSEPFISPSPSTTKSTASTTASTKSAASTKTRPTPTTTTTTRPPPSTPPSTTPPVICVALPLVGCLP